MRVVFVDAPPDLLAERSRLSLDIHDEVWEGVVHVAPSPSPEHQDISGGLIEVLRPQARARGIRYVPELNYGRPDDFRVPDNLAYRIEQQTAFGVEGPAEFAVEIRSPGDETYNKLPFYAAEGLAELLVVDRDTRVVELYLNREGRLLPQGPDALGWLRSASLGVAFRGDAEQLIVEVDGVEHRLP